MSYSAVLFSYRLSSFLNLNVKVVGMPANGVDAQSLYLCSSLHYTACQYRSQLHVFMHAALVHIVWLVTSDNVATLLLWHDQTCAAPPSFSKSNIAMAYIASNSVYTCSISVAIIQMLFTLINVCMQVKYRRLDALIFLSVIQVPCCSILRIALPYVHKYLIH